MTSQLLTCPTCGSSSITLLYQAPVFVRVTAGARVDRVIVGDESIEYTGDTYCSNPECAIRIPLTEEPDTLEWPAWEFGY